MIALVEEFRGRPSFFSYNRMTYILEGKKVVLCNSFAKWAAWMNNPNADQLKRVAETLVEQIRISTVFLGLNHGDSFPGGPPMVFETMIFGGAHNHRQWRYATWEEAEAGHAVAVKLVEGGNP